MWVASIWIIRSTVGAFELCPTNLQGDGFCDRLCMSASSHFDANEAGVSDCAERCSGHCSLEGVSSCLDECNTWDCAWSAENCGQCDEGCFISNLGNRVCDEVCNTWKCEWDNGDCNRIDSPTTVYVNSGGHMGNGSILSPFNNLVQVLLDLFLPYNDVLLLEGNFLLDPENAVPCVLLSQRGLVHTRIRGVISMWPTLKMSRKFVSFRISHFVEFINVYFDGSFDIREHCWETTCLYCPFTAFDIEREEWTDDRGTVIDISKHAPQSYCNDFHDKVFITVTQTGNVFLESVEFARFSQQLNALIINEGGQLHFKNTTFERCMAAPTGLDGGIIQHKCSDSDDPSNCGEILYEGGRVRYLNDGYEYNQDIVLTGFLRVEGIRLLRVSNVYFGFNNAMIGESISAKGVTSSTLIYLANFKQVEVVGCSFVCNIGHRSATVYVESSFFFEVDDIDQSLKHFVIRDSVFINNTALLSSVIYLSYSGDNQNIALERVSFEGNLSPNGMIRIESKSIHSEDWKGENVTIDTQQYFIPPRFVNIYNITASRNRCMKVIAVTNIANLAILYSNISENGIELRSLPDFSTAFHLFSSNPSVYMSRVPSLSISLTCTELVSLNTITNFTFAYNTFHNNSCPYSVCGVYISGSTSAIDFHDNSFRYGLGIAGIRALIRAPLYMYNLICSDNYNRDNRHAVCFDLHLTAPTDVTLLNSTFDSNNGWFGTVFYSEFVRNLIVRQVIVSRNTGLYTCAGILINPCPIVSSRIFITDSAFRSNYAASYGAVALTDHDGLLSGNRKAIVDLKVSNCEFLDNSSQNFGAGISIGTFISLSPDSYINNCMFRNNTSGEGSSVIVQSQQGVLAVSGCGFFGNRSPRGSAIHLNHFPPGAAASSVLIEDCEFVGQTGSPAIVAEGFDSKSEVTARRNRFLRGNGGWHIRTCSLLDEYSTYSFLSATDGAVLSAMNAVVDLRGVIAYNNSAQGKGGAVFLSGQSVLIMAQCTIGYNSAGDSGGALYTDQNSDLTLLHCQFVHNTADFASVLSAAPANVTIWNCTFEENFVGTVASISMAHCTARIALSRFVRNFSGERRCPGIILSSCTVEITDTEMRLHEGRNAACIQGVDHNEVTILRSQFSECRASRYGGAIFATLRSNFQISFSRFENCSSGLDGGVITAQNSNLFIDFCVFHSTHSDASGGAISAHDCDIVIRNSLFSDISPEAVQFVGGVLLEVENSTFASTTADSGAAMYIQDIQQVVVRLCVFDSNRAAANAGALLLVSSGISTKSQYTLMGNIFTRNQATAGDGGAVYARDVDLYISGNVFEGNRAGGAGGAVAVDCRLWDWCNFTVAGNEFRANVGETQGGAITWSGAFPLFDENMFLDNSSPYGSEIASFPVALRYIRDNSTPEVFIGEFEDLPIAVKLMDVASGQIFDAQVSFGLFDHSGLLVTSRTHLPAKLTYLNSSTLSVSGKTSAVSSEGRLTFTDFTLTGEPESTQYVVVSTEGIDPTLHSKVKDNTQYHDKVLIEVHFRACVSGESQQNSVCFLCASETYSLDPALPCLICPRSAICYGNNTMVPKAGYWRISNNTDNFIECLEPEACIGSPDPPFISPTGLCATGYSGNLCQHCIDGYSRTGTFQCGKCPNRTSNVAVTTLLVIFALLLLALIVWTAIKSALRQQSLIAIYAKIFMNYLQMVVVSASLNLNWPTFAKTFLNGQQMVGGMAEQLFSFDCILQDMSVSNERVHYAKVQMFSALSIVLFGLSLVAWGALSICIKIESVWKKLVSTAVIIVFIVHPSVTKMMFSLFACMNLGDGNMWLINDLEVRCWESDHVKQILLVVIPTMIILVFGLPLLTLLVLIMKKAVLESPSIKLMFCFLYKGYTRQRYYWEFVILYRKVAMIAASVFLASVSIRMQALTVLAILLLSLFLQVQVKPFFDSSLNRLEVKAILVSAITIYSGLYYSTNTLSPSMKVALFSIMVMANAYFLASWVRLVSPVLFQTLREKIQFLLARRMPYRIQAAGLSALHSRVSFPDVSSDFSSAQCGDFSSVLDPSADANPPNSLLVDPADALPREYTAEAKH